MKKSKNQIVNSTSQRVGEEVTENIESDQALLLVMKTVMPEGEITRIHIKDERIVFKALVDYANGTGEYAQVLNFIRKSRDILNSAEQYLESKLYNYSKMN